ncbi:MAG: methionine adenosyltransferase domain-containing protein [Gordonibacter pamelaeae]
MLRRDSAPTAAARSAGKPPRSVDISASWMACDTGKNLVAAGVCKRAELQVAYAIGMAHPVSVYVNTFGTGVIDDDSLAKVVRECLICALRQSSISSTLQLLSITLLPTMVLLGKEGFSWKETEIIEEVKQAVEK